MRSERKVASYTNLPLETESFNVDLANIPNLKKLLDRLDVSKNNVLKNRTQLKDYGDTSNV